MDINISTRYQLGTPGDCHFIKKFGPNFPGEIQYLPLIWTYLYWSNLSLSNSLVIQYPSATPGPPPISIAPICIFAAIPT